MEAKVETKLIKKLLNITEEMGRIPKNGYNKHFHYHFVQESDAMDRLRDLCIKHEVMIVPSVVDLTRVESLTTAKVAFGINDTATGDNITVMGYGQGADGQDKGAPKAITSAYKYFILKLFMVPTGDDVENHNTPASKKPTQSTSNEQSAMTHETHCMFGKDNGKKWADMKLDKLAWYERLFEQGIKNPEKAKFKATNEKYLKGVLNALLDKEAAVESDSEAEERSQEPNPYFD